MAVQEQYLPKSYNGNESTVTVYPVPDEWFDESTVAVFVDGASVAYNRTTGGIATLTAVANASRVVITRTTELTQPRDFAIQGETPAKKVEASADRATLQIQEQRADLLRAPLAPVGSTPSDLANRTIGYDENGNPIIRTKDEEIEFLGIRIDLLSAQQASEDAAAAALSANQALAALAEANASVPPGSPILKLLTFQGKFLTQNGNFLAQSINA